jgi:putative transposase
MIESFWADAMPQYRRAYLSGCTVFLTLVTYKRSPLFTSPEHMSRLRQALQTVLGEMPFEFVAGVVLPEHLHFLWTLPENDGNYSRRVGRMKVLFTQALRGKRCLPTTVSQSRQKHRESDVWQRRFWEHTIRDEVDFQQHFDYLHDNPVKHGWVKCPHEWEVSSFHRWVERGVYELDWGCSCGMETVERMGLGMRSGGGEEWEESSF